MTLVLAAVFFGDVTSRYQKDYLFINAYDEP